MRRSYADVAADAWDANLMRSVLFFRASDAIARTAGLAPFASKWGLTPFILARHDQTHALPVDGVLRGLARLGLRHLRRAAVQLRRAQRHPDVVRSRRSAAPEARAGGALLERHSQLHPPARLGRGRRDLRAAQRPLRAQARADDHDAPVRAGYRKLRLRHRDVAAHHLPHHREPGDWRRMGGRIGHGRRGGSRGETRRGRCVAVHERAFRPVPRGLREHARWPETGSSTTRPLPGATY